MKKNFLLGVLLSLGFLSCQDKNTFVDLPITRAIVDSVNVSISNPDLIDNWENIDEILLNTSGEAVTAPWCDGATTHLPSDFRKDIKKKDGWRILFHTFKKIGLDKKQNYICFYNQFTGYIKIFYYYEGSAKSQGTQWFVRTGNGEKTHLFSLANYIAKSDTAEANEILCSNMTGVPTDGINIGWNGFEFEVPYCTDYKGIDLILGAYDTNITSFDFVGKEDLESVGTITTTNKSEGSSGLLRGIANLAGGQAKKFVDNIVEEADFGSKLTKIISSIPGAGYISAISSGLNLIFGKTTTTTTTSDIKLSTTGNISLTGTGSSQTTADIPPISFNLYDIMNPNKKGKDGMINHSLVYNIQQSNDLTEHFVGVWALSTAPHIIYPRYTEVYNKFWNIGSSSPYPDKVYVSGKTLTPEIYPIYVRSNINPDISQYLINTDDKVSIFRCDTLNGMAYKEGIRDIEAEYVGNNLLYRDLDKCFYEAGNRKEVDCVGFAKYGASVLYYDWGVVLQGRLLCAVSVENVFSYDGTIITVNQSRIYEPQYDFDVVHVEDYEGYKDVMINYKEPAFGIHIEEKDLPLYGK